MPKEIQTSSKSNPARETEQERARRKRAGLEIKDWRKASVRFKDSPEERDAWALGEAWRKAQTDL